MELIERLKKYMATEEKTRHDITREMDVQLNTLNRWLSGKGPSHAYQEILEHFLAERGF